MRTKTAYRRFALVLCEAGGPVDCGTVQHVEYASGPVRDRFTCGEVAYEVERATPPSFTTIDELLAELISVLGCASSTGP